MGDDVSIELKTLPLSPLQTSHQSPIARTIRAPIISHFTRARRFALRSPQPNVHSKAELTFSPNLTQATLTLKPIAPAAKPCVLDKRPEYYPQDQPIFAKLAEAIRTELPETKGLELLVTHTNFSSLTTRHFLPLMPSMAGCKQQSVD